jgi:PPOX class probable F420-dependent enzyme
MSLRTYREDGSGVDCPVWFASSPDGSTLWFRSKRDTPKVRRLAANPAVTVVACDWQGRVQRGHPVLDGRARVIEDDSAEWATAEAGLAKRYGWKWNSVPLFRVPRTRTVKTELSLREKLRHIRSGAPLPNSCLIAIDLTAR